MQGSKLFVGNLNYGTTQEQLQALFEKYGKIKEIKVIEGKGFGFVELSTPQEAEKAKSELNGTDFGGRTIRVDAAKPPRDKGRRGRDRGFFRKY
ncbi:MAG: RNA-binding protein [Candidatus Hydrogenedentota bacterium]